MATVYTHKPMDQAIVSFGSQRIRELEQGMIAARNEIDMWRQIIDQQGLCAFCHGEKTMRVQDSQDESHSEQCDVCNGTGKVV